MRLVFFFCDLHEVLNILRYVREYFFRFPQFALGFYNVVSHFMRGGILLFIICTRGERMGLYSYLEGDKFSFVPYSTHFWGVLMGIPWFLLILPHLLE